jgi:hypothetical protein
MHEAEQPPTNDASGSSGTHAGAASTRAAPWVQVDQLALVAGHHVALDVINVHDTWQRAAARNRQQRQRTIISSSSTRSACATSQHAPETILQHLADCNSGWHSTSKPLSPVIISGDARKAKARQKQAQTSACRYYV